MTKNKEDKKFTLITGASMGIGKALALECAERKMNLVLIALPGSEFDEIVKLIREQFEVEVYHQAIDLTERGAPRQVLDWCMANHLSVDMLINNAGVGCVGTLEDYDTGFYETMIQLNITALLLLTRLFLPELKKQNSAHILNVSSLAGFFSMPFKIVYAASKTFVYTFSRALRIELEGTSVQVSVICPGAVDTEKNLEINQKLGGLSKISRVTPEYVAQLAVDKTLKGRAVIIPGFVNKCYLAASRLVPMSFRSRAIARVFKKGRHYK